MRSPRSFIKILPTIRKDLLAGCLFAGLVVGCTHSSKPTAPAEAKPITIDIAADQPGAKVSPTMWGAFFEDINFGADGGLYAELIKNRGFEFPEPMMGWTMIRPSNARGDVTVLTEAPFREANPHYV